VEDRNDIVCIPSGLYIPLSYTSVREYCVMRLNELIIIHFAFHKKYRISRFVINNQLNTVVEIIVKQHAHVRDTHSYEKRTQFCVPANVYVCINVCVCCIILVYGRSINHTGRTISYNLIKTLDKKMYILNARASVCVFLFEYLGF